MWLETFDGTAIYKQSGHSFTIQLYSSCNHQRLKYQKDAREVKSKILCLANTFINSDKPTKNELRKHKVMKKILQ